MRPPTGHISHIVGLLLDGLGSCGLGRSGQRVVNSQY